MILLTKNQLNNLFSFSNKFYDIISIGHTAQKVALLTQNQNNKIILKKLFVRSSATHFQPNLTILQKGQINVIKRPAPGTDIKLRNQIERIDGKKKLLILKSGEQIKFKHIIYSGQDHQWKNIDCINGLREGLSSRHTDTFADIKESNVQDLYGKISHDIYFNISSDRHFGADNYFMIHLADSLKKKTQKARSQFQNTAKIRILNKGNKLITFNQDLDAIVKNLLTQNMIQMLTYASVQKIDHRKRELVLKKDGQQKKIKYGGFYQYLDFKVPDLLALSGINPLDVDNNTLLNNKFPTIHVIGNIVPNAYSFYARNHMSHVIARNILNMELKSGKKAIYEGDTVLPFWTGANSLRYLAANYKSTKYLNNIGISHYAGKILAIYRKNFGSKQVSMYLNGSSYGLPYYFKSPQVEQINGNDRLRQNKNYHFD